jgi:penicillin G amidase
MKSTPLSPAAHLPDLNASVAIPGLSAAVDVRRDPWGIPHIRAKSTHDAFAALGFVHAQDRLWQMEALLRRGSGRYAEWVGKSALAGDTLARRVDTVGASRRDFAILGDEARAMLEAYALGVNAFIAERKWPLEYAILEVEPQLWEPWHSIAVMRQIGFLMGSVWWKLWRAAALPIVGPDQVSKLRFDDGGDDLRCIPPGAEGRRYLAALADLKPGIEALLRAQQPLEVGGGSNNWALAPGRTAGGRPLLAGDPHRVLEMPNMYCQTHLTCDAFDVIGLTVPGVPGFPHYGHSDKVAWCVTHAFMDIHDLFVEILDTDKKNSRFGNGWKPTRLRTETIAVRGAPDVDIEVVETCHGPIIAEDATSGTALALRSVQFAVPDRSFDCMLPMLRAGNVEELYDATREWGLIDHNLVAGDTEGHIGNRVRAKVPKRPRANGWLPVPGWTGDHEWSGMIAFEEMPHCIDPAGGAIVTANNRVTENDRHYFSTDSMPPHRARRIWQRLTSSKLDANNMASIHRDVLSVVALEFRDRIGALKLTGAAAELQAGIANWNGELTAGSEAAVVYAAIRATLTRLVAERSGLAAAPGYQATIPPGVFGESQLWWSIPQLLRTNDVGLIGDASWDELMTEAVETVAANRPSGTWAELHTPILRHPLSALFPEHASSLDRPSAPVGGDNDTVFATGYVARLGLRTTYASLIRYVFDVGAWDNCRWIAFHGSSGHVGSPWYDNQNVTWAAGNMVPMLYDWQQIEATSAARQTLSPVKSG